MNTNLEQALRTILDFANDCIKGTRKEEVEDAIEVVETYLNSFV